MIFDPQFLRQVSVLGSGTLIAQVILLLASPLLTRLYTPAEFGVYAFILAWVSAISPAICAKYDNALVLPKSDQKSALLTATSMQVALLLSILVFIFLLIFKPYFISSPSFEKGGAWVYSIPLLLFLTGISMTVVGVANRAQQYTIMSTSRVLQAIVIVAINLSLGWWGVGFKGLILGNIVGLLLFGLLVGRRLRLKLPLALDMQKFTVMRQYREFPLYNATSSVFDGITLSMPVFFISAYFAESIVGYFALVMRVVSVPMSFIADSVSQINMRKVVEMAHNRENIVVHVLKLTLILACTVMPALFVLIYFSENLFVFVFGSTWREAGWLASLMAPALAVRFVVSTLSSTITATNNNLFSMWWKLGAFASTALFFVIMAPKTDFKSLVTAFVFLDIVLYLLYYGLILLAANNPRVE